MYYNKLKKFAAILLAGTLVFSLAACRGGKDKKQEGAESASTEAVGDTQEQIDIEDNLPEDFGNMIYPLEALMVQSYSKGLPYYGEDADGEDADSFWFSMAVLTSQMNNYVKDVAENTDDRFIYINEDTANMYASALYDAYARGNMEFPELPEDNTYATYDEENEAYGFRKGNVGDLEPMVTECVKDGADYTLTAELRDSNSSKVVGIYNFTITKNSYEGEENAFAYAVSDCKTIQVEEEMPEEKTEEASETTTEEEPEEATTEEEHPQNTNAISQEEALELAKGYYGEEAEYSYKGMVTVGDYEYFNFSVSGDDISATDVLVSENGKDVIGGVMNEDGSWSFDQ